MQVSAESPENKRLFLISLALLLLRIILLQQYVTTNPFFSHPIADSELYLQWAESILEGKAYFEQEYHHPPGYAFFLAGMLLLSGSNLYVIAAIQSLLVTIQSALLFLCAKRLFGNKTAWAAFLLYSFVGPVLFYSMKILSETLYTTLVLASFFFLLRYYDEARLREIFLCGLFLGMAIEVRGNATICFWPSLAVALLATKIWRSRLTAAALLVLGTSLCTVPVLVRNISVAGAWTPVASNWGENFYFANSPEATGAHPLIKGIRSNILDQIPDVQKEASRRAGRKLTSLEAQRFWFREGWKFIRTQPLNWIKLESVKLRRMLQRHIPSGIYSYPLETKFYHHYLTYFPGYGLLFPLFFAGLPAIPWNRRTVLFLIYLATQAGLLLLYWPEERYMLPVIPFLIMGAGCLVLIKRESFKPSGRLIACAAGLLLCLYANLNLIPPRGISAWYSNASSAHFSKQEFQQAAFMASEALKLDRGYVEAWTNLGSALFTIGKTQEARNAWLQALRYNSSDVMTLRNLAISYERENRGTSLVWWERTLKAAMAQELPPETITAIKNRISELRSF
ncbi:glycosyltransferase family 39 protein [bacterium]|nr:glycosyltransferase family 39 protein [bacterium]